MEVSYKLRLSLSVCISLLPSSQSLPSAVQTPCPATHWPSCANTRHLPRRVLLSRLWSGWSSDHAELSPQRAFLLSEPEPLPRVPRSVGVSTGPSPTRPVSGDTSSTAPVKQESEDGARGLSLARDLSVEWPKRKGWLYIFK